jgi:hypothetical protein
LPAGWSTHFSNSKQAPYYRNDVTGDVSWTRPDAEAEAVAEAAPLPEGWTERCGRSAATHWPIVLRDVNATSPPLRSLPPPSLAGIATASRRRTTLMIRLAKRPGSGQWSKARPQPSMSMSMPRALWSRKPRYPKVTSKDSAIVSRCVWASGARMVVLRCPLHKPRHNSLRLPLPITGELLRQPCHWRDVVGQTGGLGLGLAVSLSPPSITFPGHGLAIFSQ